ncbi:MAG: recombination protein NinG [Acidobacteriota bacterium]|nr:MAG: recombination protein NinG [Acidobacteriota bacterium]
MESRMKVKKLDRDFSELVRALARWACARCGRDLTWDRQRLHSSHHFVRGRKSVRFDLVNCDALCADCHDEFHRSPAAYRDWMIDRLGEDGYETLTRRANRIAKFTPGDWTQLEAQLALALKLVSAFEEIPSVPWKKILLSG